MKRGPAETGQSGNRVSPKNFVPGQWTSMSGQDSSYWSGVPGTLGTAAAANVPGSRQNSVSWKDGSGNLWLFGGETDYQVTWTESSPAGLYEIQESQDPAFSVATTRIESALQSFFNHGSAGGTSYSYRVRAVDSCAGIGYRSAWSNVVPVNVGSSMTSAGTNFYTLSPCRLYDTRKTSPAVEAAAPSSSGNETRYFYPAGRCGIPVDAKMWTPRS
jgi:hypothetical protein